MVAEERTSYGWGRNYKYCIAGMGRVGATMLTRYLTAKFSAKHGSWVVARGIITGIHARDFVEFDGKVVFLFGNPYNSAISFRNLRGFGKSHFRNLGMPFVGKGLFWDEDIFGLEKLFDDWYRPHQFQLATIRYEKLWHNLNRLSEYLELDLSDFPKYEKRETDWNNLGDKKKKRLFLTYGRLYNKVKSAKDFKIWT